MTAPTAPVALITGAGGGIAKSIVSRLLGEGWRLELADLDPAQVEQALAELPPADRNRVRVHRLDVTDEDSCQRVAQDSAARSGGLDALINAAGIMIRRDANATTSGDWRRVLDVNLTGSFLMAKACYPALRASDRAAIVSVSSSHAVLAARGSVAYSVSKAGLSHLTRLLALEWAPDQIRVNAVAPTVVPSPMTADVLADPAYVDRKLAAIPLGRPIQPEHVAAATSYLLSPDSGSTTGQTLLLDGGESLA
ncbi:SDR family NAD(P)-dependent oxidoreductase [Georgenia yuyongxinii]|uniref:SDR family oxidoreductase n=1 Tax=Georgenia yuyongxinii TaxID=2589797 RepID=A0A552WY96_9MICO|nr:SDR family oxidoreductase [Georgenia yuyongxinii]TRW47589.1 SDR family oxidoreductase [Georgenia yuyongxinii]